MDTPSATRPDAYSFSAEEVRVLGVLIEKSRITPDNYPLSVNAIMQGSNQTTSRDPVMHLDETRIQDALDSLQQHKLVTQRDQASARVAKYEHQIRLRFSLPPPEQAVLATLMLRGPQTAGEIRQRSERMHGFASIDEVDSVLTHLAEKYPPLVCALPRQPGTKETRYMHLMSGEPTEEMLAAATTGTSRAAAATSVAGELEALRAEIKTLREEFEQFRAQFN